MSVSDRFSVSEPEIVVQNVPVDRPRRQVQLPARLRDPDIIVEMPKPSQTQTSDLPAELIDAINLISNDTQDNWKRVINKRQRQLIKKRQLKINLVSNWQYILDNFETYKASQPSTKHWTTSQWVNYLLTGDPHEWRDVSDDDDYGLPNFNPPAPDQPDLPLPPESDQPAPERTDSSSSTLTAADDSFQSACSSPSGSPSGSPATTSTANYVLPSTSDAVRAFFTGRTPAHFTRRRLEAAGLQLSDQVLHQYPDEKQRKS